MSSDFDFAWKKLNDSLKKQIKTEKDRENYLETLKSSAVSCLLKQRQERLKEKLDDKIDEIDSKIKGKIDYYKRQIKETKASTDSKVDFLQNKLKTSLEKGQREIDAMESRIKEIHNKMMTQEKNIEKEIEMLLSNNESYQTSCYDAIDSLMQKKTKQQEKLEKQKDSVLIPTTPAEEKKLVKLEVNQQAFSKDAEDAADKLLTVMHQEKSFKQKEILEEIQKEETKERQHLEEEKQKRLQEIQREKQEEQRKDNERRERNKKEIETIMRRENVNLDIATIMFQYNRSRKDAIKEYNKKNPDSLFVEKSIKCEKKSIPVDDDESYIWSEDENKEEQKEEEDEPIFEMKKKEDSKVYKDILESLELFSTLQEKQGYLKMLPILQSKKIHPTWFTLRINEILTNPSPYPNIITNSKIASTKRRFKSQLF